MPPATDLRQQAQATFTQLATVFAQSDNMWRLGHTFDTIIDYLTLEPGQAPGFGPTAVQAWHPLAGAWFDDYAWWGISALRASLAPDLFTGSLYAFKRIAQSMWGIMDGNAPWVWDNAEDSLQKDSYRPRFEGGVWNSNWTDSRWAAGFGNDPPGLSGIQNTVTNGLYLVLATRLYRAGGTAATREAADREWGFLSDWFGVENPQESLLMQLPSGGVLVRERVSTYANGNQVDGYYADTAWAGDQGLILGGLVDRMAILGSDHPERADLLDLATRILQGVQEKMVQDGELQPWIGPTPGNDPDDYLTGIAVFMRYLLYAFNNCPELREPIRSDFAKLAASNGQEQPSKNPNWRDGDVTQEMTLITNQLALLVAAIVLTEAE